MLGIKPDGYNVTAVSHLEQYEFRHAYRMFQKRPLKKATQTRYNRHD